MSQQPQTVPLSTIAKLLDLSERQVQNLANEGIIPKPDKRGEYELVGCIRGYIDFLKSKTSPEMIESKTRMARAKTEEQEIKVQRLRGELVRVDELLSALIAILTLFKTTMRAIPSKVAPRCRMAKTDGQTQDLLQKEIDVALGELSKALVELKDRLNGQRDAPETDSEIPPGGSPSP